MGKRDRANDAQQSRSAGNTDSVSDQIKTLDAASETSVNVVIPISRRAIALLCLMIIAPWLIVIAGTMFIAKQSPKNIPVAKSMTTAVRNTAVEVTPGAEWGRHRIRESRFHLPSSSSRSSMCPRSARTGIFQKLGQRISISGWPSSVFPKPCVKNLRSCADSSLDEVIHVTNVVLEKIPLATRSKVYDYLAQDPRNVDQFNAFRYCGESFDEWFQSSNLRPELVEKIRSMVYSRGPVYFFADLRLIIPLLESDRERARLLKVLSRESTRLVRLHVDRNTDIEQMVDYWGRFGRAKDVRPILESLALSPGGGTIDLVHLLPPFARERIYTYPGTANRNLIVNRNSHWTALNFYNDVADDRYASMDQVGVALMDDFYQIAGEPKFGDIVGFTGKNGDLFHSGVFIADEMIYTKNGPRVSRPWMLLSIEEMINYYPRREPSELRYFRRKDS